MKNMWADYYMERVGGKVVWTDNVGFIAYRIEADVCFIDDAYVSPGSRRRKEAGAMLQEVVDDARAKGCKFLGAEIDLRTLTAEASLAASIGNGFRVIEGSGKILLLRKDI